jgi:hypothetical protein
MPIIQNVLVEDADLPAVLPYLIQQGAGSNPIFLPPVIPGLIVWLRADQGITLSGGNVTVWADLSGNGNSTTAGTSGAWNASDPQYNGQASITFVHASSNHLTIGSISGSTGQPFTSFIVGNSSNAATEGTFQNGTSTTCSAGFFDDATGNIYMSAGTQLDTNVSGLNPCIMAFIGNGVSCQGFVNNSQAPVITGNMGTDSFSGQGMQIGTGGVTSLDGKIAEILLYNGALTAVQRHQVFAYLANRYGILGAI